jgi:F0F1-type ATP synthase membrane subunit b/b'
MNRAACSVFAVMVLVAVWGWSARAAPPPDERAVRANAQQDPSSETAEPGNKESGPQPINWFEFGKEEPPFIAMIVNFGILAAGYYLLGRKPIAAALQNRRDSIAREIEEAQRIKSEAEARAKVYQAKLESLEADVRAAREALLRAGEAERDRIVAEAEAKAERIRNDAEFIAMQELKQIRLDLWREALEAATLAAEELLKKRVSYEDQERLAEDYLVELSGKKNEHIGSADEYPRTGSLGSGPGSPS